METRVLSILRRLTNYITVLILDKKKKKRKKTRKKERGGVETRSRNSVSDVSGLVIYTV